MDMSNIGNYRRTVTLTAEVELQFVVPAALADSLLDQQTGAVDVTLVADAMSALLGNHESHYLRVKDADWQY